MLYEVITLVDGGLRRAEKAGELPLAQTLAEADLTNPTPHRFLVEILHPHASPTPEPYPGI